MTESTASWSQQPGRHISLSVADLTADDCNKLAALCDSVSEVVQPRIRDGRAEARVGFLRMLSAALRESAHVGSHGVSRFGTQHDTAEFYGDGDPGSSS